MRLEQAGVGTCLNRSGNAWRLRAIIYNTSKVEDQTEVPQSIFDLASPEFAPHSCLANPQFGTTSMHLALLFDAYGDDVARKFLANFSANGGTMVASKGEVKRRVSSGEFTFGLTDSDDVNVALTDGKPVGFVFPDREGKGVVGIPTLVLQVNNPPHPEPAQKLAAVSWASEPAEGMG